MDNENPGQNSVVILHPKNDTERFFGNAENEKFYLEAEKAVAKEYSAVEFDWRTFLAVLFGRI